MAGVCGFFGGVADQQLLTSLDGNTGADFNRYAYVGNNPLNATDPTGRSAVAGVVVVGFGIYVVYSACEASGGCDSARDVAETFIKGFQDVATSRDRLLNEAAQPKTATASPDGTVTDAQGKEIKGESGGPGARKRLPAESPKTKSSRKMTSQQLTAAHPGVGAGTLAVCRRMARHKTMLSIV